MSIQNLVTIVFSIISLILVFIGAGFIGMYFWEGIILRIGDSDQSLIFWYLPILFIGILSLGSGIILFIASYKKLNQNKT